MRIEVTGALEVGQRTRLVVAVGADLDPLLPLGPVELAAGPGPPVRDVHPEVPRETLRPGFVGLPLYTLDVRFRGLERGVEELETALARHQTRRRMLDLGRVLGRRQDRLVEGRCLGVVLLLEERVRLLPGVVLPPGERADAPDDHEGEQENEDRGERASMRTGHGSPSGSRKAPSNPGGASPPRLDVEIPRWFPPVSGVRGPRSGAAGPARRPPGRRRRRFPTSGGRPRR